ncbi:MAG: 5-methyltetrahydropteroyltriglutamate--homocysteine methyltransferase [Desulfobulbaceae bacterium]|nr:5-methyltetrahydropteroyltriglutamate--homocysteine methyltransferase [Desulfobulbaceae bacterium]HIJ77919.1 5-methyltetrahydropteroyltriglutamate--homocysteine methyltransferase [Deltaproteobacteria bacterium]
MPIPTEPIGSVPRSPELQKAMQDFAEGSISAGEMDFYLDEAVRETIEQFEATGSPVITDGEQAKPSFATYPLANLDNLAPNGVIIPFKDGHIRQLPQLTSGPFRYGVYAGSYLERAKKYASKPLKQAVISASAISLLYPTTPIAGYSQAQFIDDLIRQAVSDIRSCFDNGAHCVQIDFTEGRLAVKLDPSKGLLQQFIDLNNQVLSHFTPAQRQRIGVHTCPGGDQDSTHSADVAYDELIPLLLTLDVGNFYMQMASEADPEKALRVIGEHLKPQQRVYIGVIDVINEDVESAETVRNRIMTAAEFIPVAQLGTTDDCGFSPFSDDTATARNIAFAKISARIRGTEMAAAQLGV